MINTSRENEFFKIKKKLTKKEKSSKTSKKPPKARTTKNHSDC